MKGAGRREVAIRKLTRVRVALRHLLHGAFCLRLYRACPQAFFDMWVQMENAEENYDSLSDLLMREQMVENASPDMKVFLRQWKPKTAEEMVTLADNFLDAHKPRGPFKPSASAQAAGAQHAKAKVASPDDKLKIPKVDTTGLGNKASLVKDTNRKLLRWSLELQEFDYEVKYVRGEANVLADALSRLN
nr:hypothetical protein BaRGS_030598 [Batillaria attramentaria]